MIRVIGLFAISAAIFFGRLPTTLNAQDSGKVHALKLEKAALEERLAEIDRELDTIWAGDGIEFLGMTLVPFSDELRAKYEITDDVPQGPIVIQPPTQGVFLEETAPSAGCVMIIVQHPAKSFSFNAERSETHRPRNVREFLEAVNVCTITPQAYEQIWGNMVRGSRDRAEELADQPELRDRFLTIAEKSMPIEDKGKHICRVVYYDPDLNGTMTTHIRLTKDDLDQLELLLAN